MSKTQKLSRRPAMWGGIECTINRVQNRFFDQLYKNKHDVRPDDIQRFQELGLRTLRYPILWERFEAQPNTPIDWSWADERLALLQELGIEPIIGFLHHGSGPAWTHLTDPLFPDALAHFAERFAKRYPWVRYYTPINEPLTTARFSGLYGLWYPHGCADNIFIKALINECVAVARSMQAIRKINPQAQLVQTDDLGRVFSTPYLQYQADFENERRWLSWDLLCGHVDPKHPMWGFLRDCGAAPDHLQEFLDTPCPPDIIGINHYLLSNRYLDERLELYPPRYHGGNGRDRYADVEAVRVGGENYARPQEILKEAWERYKIPLAVTEVHLDCTREEQLRWLLEIWDAACELREANIPVVAVTAWGLLGLYDWNSLVTREENYYEPGAFDVRGPTPRPTAIASLVRDLAQGKNPTHPVLARKPWWHLPKRWLYPPHPNPQLIEKNTAPLVIVGATGTLGRAFVRICELRNIPTRALTRQEMDASDAHSVECMLQELKPWALVNAAGYVRVDHAEQDPQRCHRDNVAAAETLARACAQREIPFVTFSSDLVFDGRNSTPYLESHPVAPLNVYGRTKAEAEECVLRGHPQALVVRTSAFFGPWDEHNFVTITLRRLRAGERIVVPHEVMVSPTYVPDLVNATLDLLLDGECGIWHLANQGAVSWYDLARDCAERSKNESARIEPALLSDLAWLATRPKYSVLQSERGQLLPSLEGALTRYFQEISPLR